MAVVAALFSPAVVAGGDRLQVRLEQPFRVNGENFPSGTITVKTIRDYNPSTTLQEVWVDGHCLGMMMAAKRAATDDEAPRDVLHFQRGDDGRLVLVGFATRNEREANLYHYTRVAGKNRWAAPEQPTDTILIAAFRR